MNTQGEMMDALAFDAKSFVRIVLPTIALYISAIVISLTMFRHVHAEGIVNFSGTPVLPYQMCATDYKNYWCVPTAGDKPTLSECLALADIMPYFYERIRINVIGYGCYWGSSAYGNQYGQCPVNSTIGLPIRQYTLSCTCNTGYRPDSTQTSCINNEQYTISIQPAPTNNGAYTIVPSTILPLEAIVKDQNGVAQQGKQVTLTVDVQGGTGGHIHNENRPKGIFTCGSMGTSWTCTLTTGYNGQAPFIFVSTPVSGAHTITASCTGCGNTATAPVNVKVDNLIPIPASPQLYALQDSTGAVIGAISGKHTANHYLTATAIGELRDLATLYTTEINPNKILYLNDASLVWGGLFDVGSTPWVSPHIGHNRGVSIDIRAENSGPNSEGAVPSTLFTKFSEQAAKKHIKAALHCAGGQSGTVCNGIPDNRHFHVDF